MASAAMTGSAPAGPQRDAVLPSPGVHLPARPRRAARAAALWTSAGLAGYGAASLVSWPVAAAAALAAGLVLAAAAARVAVRARWRAQLLDALAEALYRDLGLTKPARESVTASRWTREPRRSRTAGSARRPAAPRRLQLRYAPGVADNDPSWVAGILDTVQRRLQVPYTVRRHNTTDRRRCRLLLAIAPPPPDRAAVSPLVERAARAITELVGPTGRVSDPQLTGDGELTAFTVHHSAGSKLAAAGYRRRVEQVVSTMLPGRWRAHWDLEADTARFSIRPNFPQSIWLPVRAIDADRDVLASYDAVEIPYGVDEDGNVMVWRPALDPNVMLVGSPGTGKTVTDHTILVEATRHGWPVWVVDGKSIEFLGFEDWPNVQVVATTIEQQVAVIQRAWEVMEHRYALITSGRARESDFEPLLVFLDEFADFRSNLMAWYSEIKVKGDPTKPVALSRVASIARKGRTSRVHLVFSTQRPDAEYFGGDMRDNFRMRVSMGRLSPQGAMMMWESPAVGTSIPRGCRGRATTINDANRAVEIQTYRTPDPRKTDPGSSEDELLRRLRPNAAGHERLLILPPTVDVDLDSGDRDDPTYSDYAAATWVLASTRPDLDPVAHRRHISEGGRELASPMAIFGLTGVAAAPPVDLSKSADTSSATGAGDRWLTAVHGAEAGVGAEADGWTGYGPVTSCYPAKVSVGDLVLVDDEFDRWAVVDADPEPDYADPGCVAVSWRGDGDECGALSVPEDAPVPVRRPADLDVEE